MIETGQQKGSPWQTIVSAVSVTVAVLSLYFLQSQIRAAREQNELARKVAVGQLYLALKEQFYRVSQELPPDYAEPGAEPYAKNTPEWRALKSYWYQSFDEWYVSTQVLGDSLVWRGYYSEVLRSSIEKRRMRVVLCDMSKDQMRAGMRHQFYREMDALSKASRRERGICDE